MGQFLLELMLKNRTGDNRLSSVQENNRKQNKPAIPNGTVASSPMEMWGISVSRMIQFHLELVPWKCCLSFAGFIDCIVSHARYMPPVFGTYSKGMD